MGFARLIFDNETQSVTLARDANGFIALDGGLETPVLLSLGTDKRARPSDRETDRRGWWGDDHGLVDGDQIGSWLWLLRREPMTNKTIRRSKLYAEEALRWLIADGLAKSVVAVAESSKEHEAIWLDITVTKPDGSPWEAVWRIHRDAV